MVIFIKLVLQDARYHEHKKSILVSSVGSFFSNVNDARSHEPEVIVAASIRKLAVDQLVKKFPVTFETRKVITTVTRVCH